MSKLERFVLGSGVMGLVADLIILASFISGTWTIGSVSETSSGFVLFVIITGLIWVYGWLSISWYVARRRLNSARKKAAQPKVGLGVIFRSVYESYIFLLPIATTWLIAVLQPTLQTAPDKQSRGGMIIFWIGAGVVVSGISIVVVGVAETQLMRRLYQDLTSPEAFKDQETKPLYRH